MKQLLLFTIALTILCLGACKKEESNYPEPEPETSGTLVFNITTWNAQNNMKSVASLNTCKIVDIRHLIPSIQISKDEVMQGGNVNSVNWITMYESSNEMLHTEREVTIKIPAGKYRSIKLVQRNKLYWVCEHNDQIVELTDYNYGTEMGADELGINYFAEDGLYMDDGGKFDKVLNDEKLGMIEIKAGKTTHLTMRLNFTTLDWADNDNSGDWSDGDKLDNWKLPDGIDTMTDFIVEYE